MNSVVLIGRLTKDPEYRESQGGLAICQMQMAVDRPAKDGEKKTDFPRIIVFGKQAENCNKYLAKGKQIGVQGRLQTGSYENKDGQKVYTTDVIADRVEFLSPLESGEKPKEDFRQINEDVPF